MYYSICQESYALNVFVCQFMCQTAWFFFVFHMSRTNYCSYVYAN